MQVGWPGHWLPANRTDFQPVIESHAMTARFPIFARCCLLAALAMLAVSPTPVMAVDTAAAKTAVVAAKPKLSTDDCALSPEDAKKADEWKAMTPQQREVRRAERKAEYQKMSPEQKAEVRAKMEKRKQCRLQRQGQNPAPVPAAATPAVK